jgi:hypothetical protein
MWKDGKTAQLLILLLVRKKEVLAAPVKAEEHDQVCGSHGQSEYHKGQRMWLHGDKWIYSAKTVTVEMEGDNRAAWLWGSKVSGERAQVCQARDPCPNER